MSKEIEKEPNLHEGHRQRMKQRFRNSGFDGMSDHEVLEYMLFYVFKQGNTNEIAHRLIKTFGSLAGVLEADYESLIQVSGIKENAASYIKSILPLFTRYHASVKAKKDMTDGDQCGEFFMSYYYGLKTEKVMVMLLDTACKMITAETVCEGDLDSATFNLRRLVEIVVRNKAAAIVLAHNHPGGIALPSKEDVDATIGIRNALAAMGIMLLDHVILTEDDYVSMGKSASFKQMFKEIEKIV